MPRIKIIFHEADPLFNIKLDRVLNQTEQDQELYASVYRDPGFINSLRDKTDYGVAEIISLALATISLLGIIYLITRLCKVNMALMILQAQLTAVARAVESLQLTRRPKPTKPTQPNIHQVIQEVSANYWFYFIAIILLLALIRKTG